MKRLTLALFSLLIVVLCGISVVAQRRTATPPVARSPEIVLKEFYQWYIHEVNRPSKNYAWKTTRGRAILKKYVSLRFIRAIDRNEKLPAESDPFDADYFLLDQDTSGYTEKNIWVSKVAVKGTTATANVSLGGWKLKVSLIQEGGVWKIDKVKNESGTGLVK
jgi:hypothetical protein